MSQGFGSLSLPKRKIAMPSEFLQFEDHFLGTTLNTNMWTTFVGASGTTFAVQADQLNGVIKATTGTTGGVIANNGVQICGSALNLRLSDGGFQFAAKVKSSAVTGVALFVGLTDVVALECPIDYTGGVLNTVASNAVGFVHDNRKDTVLHCVGVNSDTDKTPIDTVVSLAANTYKTLWMEGDSLGNISFGADSTRLGRIDAACSPTALLTPTICAYQSAGTTAEDISCDFIYYGKAVV